MSKISGSALLGQFDDVVSGYTERTRQLDWSIAAAERDIAAANQRREQAYVELASYYCEEREKFAETLSSISRNIQEQFDQKASRRQAIEADIARSQNLIVQTNADLSQAQQDRDLAAEELAAGMARVEKALAVNEEYLALKTSHAESCAKLRQEATETQLLKKEAAGKLQAYQANRLFMYLVKIGYSTSEYKRRGLAARGDRWLADKVSWPVNFRNYGVLVELPAFADQRQAGSKRDLDVLAARLELRVSEVERTEGLEEARLKHNRRCQTVAAIQQNLGQSQVQLNTLLEERKALETNTDPYVRKAKDAIKAMLAGESVASLRAKVAKTATVRDDELVTVLEQAEEIINKGRETIKALRVERDASLERSRLARIARNKFSNSYTGSYDRFDNNLNINQLLLGFLAGQVTEGHFWNRVDTCHHDLTPVSTYHSSSWSSSDSSSSGGGGGFSFGGGDSGGGGGSSFGGGD